MELVRTWSVSSTTDEGPLVKKRKVKPAFTPQYQGPAKRDIVEARKQHLSDGQYTFYKEPLLLVEGAMQYIFDEQVLLALTSSPVRVLLKITLSQDLKDAHSFGFSFCQGTHTPQAADERPTAGGYWTTVVG